MPSGGGFIDNNNNNGDDDSLPQFTGCGNGNKDNRMTNNKMSSGMIIMVMMNLMTSQAFVAV